MQKVVRIEKQKRRVQNQRRSKTVHDKSDIQLKKQVVCNEKIGGKKHYREENLKLVDFKKYVTTRKGQGAVVEINLSGLTQSSNHW